MYLSLLCLASLISLLSEEVDGCSVTPSAAAVVAGGNLSLTCTTKNKQDVIDMWKFGSDTSGASSLYQAPFYYNDGSIRVERKVKDGYLANDTTDGQVILTIITASPNEADFYYCICTESNYSSGFAYVSVLASEPTFSNATEIIDGEPVIFNCSVSFSGLANVSITIADSFGRNLNTSQYPVTSKGLYVFDLEYSITANSSTSQEYFCNIILTNDTSKTVIYSRRLDFAVQWVSVRNAQINPTNVTRCKHNNQCSINQTIRCTAEGNPKPLTFQWLASINVTGFTMNETGDDHFTFETVGDYAVQCIAYNEFSGTRYSSSSAIFKTQVLVNGPVYGPAGGSQSGGTNNSVLIIGLVVGLGGSMITVTIIALTAAMVWKRKRSQQTKKEMYTSLDVQRSATHPLPEQAAYTELNASSVSSERARDHRVAAGNYQNIELDLNEQTKKEMYTSLDVQRSSTHPLPEQATYTELNASPVGSEPARDHRVAAGNYQNVELDLNEQTKMEMYTSLDVQRSSTHPIPEQATYTELNASPVGSETQNVTAAENYENI